MFLCLLYCFVSFTQAPLIFRTRDFVNSSLLWVLTHKTDSFRIDWLDLLAVQGTLRSLLQHHCCSISPLVFREKLEVGTSLLMVRHYAESGVDAKNVEGNTLSYLFWCIFSFVLRSESFRIFLSKLLCVAVRFVCLYEEGSSGTSFVTTILLLLNF